MKFKVKDVGDGVYFIPNGTKIIGIKDEYIFEEEDENDKCIPEGENDIFYRELLEKHKVVEERIKDWEIIYLCRAYQCYQVYLLDKMPIKIKSEGSGFNYGSCNIIPVNEPGTILVLAADD